MDAIACPCCGNAVAEPPLDIVIEHFGVSEFEARILSPLWKAGGKPISAERIYDSMYANDRSGQPSPVKMYEALKFGLLRLRRRLAGSGFSIESAGYGKGFLLSRGDR